MLHYGHRASGGRQEKGGKGLFTSYGGTKPRLLLPGSPTLKEPGTSLVIQWLRRHTPGAGGLRLIPGQGSRFPHAQLKVCMPQTEIHIPQIKTWPSQINE